MNSRNKHTSQLLEKLPPHAIEAEMCVLGSILVDQGVLDDIVQLIGPDDFWKPANGSIFRAMVDFRNKHGSLDIVQLHQTLVDIDILDAVGGQKYLMELASSVPMAQNAEHYARLVRGKAIVRRLIEYAGHVFQSAHERPGDPEALLDEAESMLLGIGDHADQHVAVPVHELFSKTIESLDQTNQNDASLSTGFAEFDRLTGGLRQGEFVVIAARPSIGKTSLALTMAMNIARSTGPVGFFSLEMSKRELTQRVLSTASGVSSHLMRCRLLRSDEFAKLCVASTDLTPMPLIIDDTPSLTSMQLRSKARRLAAKHNISAVFVDYLQLLRVVGRVESRRVEVGQISREMKALARELDLPVVCLCQLNRASESRKSRRPRLNDLRESGDLEQDADVVALLHNEDYYRRQVDPKHKPANVAELIIAKQRNGPVGTVKLHWDGSTMTFRDLGHDVVESPNEEKSEAHLFNNDAKDDMP